MHDPIKPLADRLMRAVVATGAVNKANMDAALDVMRAELKEFLVGAEYADARYCAQTQSLSDATIFGLLVANTTAKILKA
jgi:hypothetical protein